MYVVLKKNGKTENDEMSVVGFTGESPRFGPQALWEERASLPPARLLSHQTREHLELSKAVFPETLLPGRLCIMSLSLPSCVCPLCLFLKLYLPRVRKFYPCGRSPGSSGRACLCVRREGAEGQGSWFTRSEPMAGSGGTRLIISPVSILENFTVSS